MQPERASDCPEFRTKVVETALLTTINSLCGIGAYDSYLFIQRLGWNDRRALRRPRGEDRHAATQIEGGRQRPWRQVAPFGAASARAPACDRASGGRRHHDRLL